MDHNWKIVIDSSLIPSGTVWVCTRCGGVSHRVKAGKPSPNAAAWYDENQPKLRDCDAVIAARIISE